MNLSKDQVEQLECAKSELLQIKKSAVVGNFFAPQEIQGCADLAIGWIERVLRRERLATSRKLKKPIKTRHLV